MALKSGKKTLQLWDVATGKRKTPLDPTVPAVVTELPGCLVVTHTQRGHEQITNLLHQLHRVSTGEKGPAKQLAVVDVKRIGPAGRRIREALGEETETGFVESPLSEAISFLSAYHKITIFLDEAALSEEGLATDEVISLDVAGITLRSALNMMLEPLQLTYIIENEVLKITTKIVADEKLETHVYDVGSLAKADLDSEELAEVVERNIEGGRPQSRVTSVVFSPDGKTVSLKSGEETLQLWDAATGKPMMTLKQVAPAVITALPGCLVVTHTQRGHEQIADLLAQLERLVQCGGAD